MQAKAVGAMPGAVWRRRSSATPGAGISACSAQRCTSGFSPNPPHANAQDNKQTQLSSTRCLQAWIWAAAGWHPCQEPGAKLAGENRRFGKGKGGFVSCRWRRQASHEWRVPRASFSSHVEGTVPLAPPLGNEIPSDLHGHQKATAWSDCVATIAGEAAGD